MASGPHFHLIGSNPLPANELGAAILWMAAPNWRAQQDSNLQSSD